MARKLLPSFFFLFIFIFTTQLVLADPEYVVITTDAFDEAFQNLTSWKETRGLYTERTNLTTHIELLTNITSNSSFWSGGYWNCSESNDTQSQIRNYVNYTYTNHSTQYILLGGYIDIVPARFRDHSFGYDECDLYYANIDELITTRTYDEDWTFEISVGRIPFFNVTELDRWIARQIFYENLTNEEWAKKVIVTGAYGFGSRACNEVFDLDNTKQLDVTKIYQRDKDTGYLDWGYTPDMSPQFLMYSGHGSSTSFTMNTALYNNISNLTYPYINYGGGCSQGEFTNTSGWRDLLFAYKRVTENRTGIAHFGAASTCGGGVFKDLLTNTINFSLEPTSTHLGTSLGTAFRMAAELYNFEDTNLLGCPEVQPYLSNYNITAQLETVEKGAMLYYYGDTEYDKLHPLSFWLKNNTLLGTASGSSFSNYSITLGYWNNITYYVGQTLVQYPDGYHPVIDTETVNNNRNTSPDNYLTDCFIISDPDLQVNNTIIATLNATKLLWFPKGVYEATLTVTNTDGKLISHPTYFSGFGYLEGIAYYPGNNTEVPVGTDVNITYLNSTLSENTVTVQTFLHSGHTGYYNFSFWNISIQPTYTNTTPYIVPTIWSNVTAECKGISSTETYYLGGPEPFMTLDLNSLSPQINNVTPSHLSSNIPINTPSVSVNISDPDSSFNWTIEGGCLNNTNGTADTNGTKTANITSTLTYGVTYTWYVNVSDGISSLSEVYIFTAVSNDPPAFSNESPTNSSTNTSTYFTWNVTILDLDGDTFNWTIECSNGQSSSDNDASNGSKTLTLSSLTSNTTYYIFVNATDGKEDSSAWYLFTTTNLTTVSIRITAETPEFSQLTDVWIKAGAIIGFLMVIFALGLILTSRREY